MMNNWKTTTTGTATLLASFAALLSHLSMMVKTGVFDLNLLIVDIGLISGGVGLVFAKDYDKTGV
jgi:hypothetical protein